RRSGRAAQGALRLASCRDVPPPDRSRNRLAAGGRLESRGRRPRRSAFAGRLDEAITETDDGLDLPARGAELAAEASDVDVHATCLDEAVVAPDTLEQAIAREDAVPVLHQVAEQLELPPREPHGLAIHGHRHSLEIGHDVLAAIHG